MDAEFHTAKLSEVDRITLLEKHFLVLDSQVRRIVADIESEKGTRARLNVTLTDSIESMDKRLRLVERSIWIGFGALGVIQFFLAK
jgi:hypothetical protein